MKYKYIRECINRDCIRTTDTPCYNNTCEQYKAASFKGCKAECVNRSCFRLPREINKPCYDVKCPTYQEAISLKIELG